MSQLLLLVLLFVFRSASAGSESEGSGGATPVVSRQNSAYGLKEADLLIKDKSPSSGKEFKEKIIASSKIIIEKVLSPTKDKPAEKSLVPTTFLFTKNFWPAHNYTYL